MVITFWYLSLQQPISIYTEHLLMARNIFLDCLTCYMSFLIWRTRNVTFHLIFYWILHFLVLFGGPLYNNITIGWFEKLQLKKNYLSQDYCSGQSIIVRIPAECFFRNTSWHCFRVIILLWKMELAPIKRHHGVWYGLAKWIASLIKIPFTLYKNLPLNQHQSPPDHHISSTMHFTCSMSHSCSPQRSLYPVFLCLISVLLFFHTWGNFKVTSSYCITKGWPYILTHFSLNVKSGASHQWH